jgi:hypothetical protein
MMILCVLLISVGLYVSYSDILIIFLGLYHQSSFELTPLHNCLICSHRPINILILPRAKLSSSLNSSSSIFAVVAVASLRYTSIQSLIIALTLTVFGGGPRPWM